VQALVAKYLESNLETQHNNKLLSQHSWS
jgi:hypothetical protein